MEDKIIAKSRSRSIILLLLARGEFRVLNIILLLSVYGAAILAIPLVLSSLFQLSTVFLQLQEETSFAALLLSIYNHTQSSYGLVEISLFLGFAVTSLVSGISIGRRMTTVDAGFAHLGVSGAERNRSIATAFLLISLICVTLAFGFSFVFASIGLYSASMLLHGPYLTPALSSLFWIYLTMIPLIAFVSLIIGWSRVKIS